MTSLATAAPAPRPLFRNRTFLSIWFGHALSVVGDGFSSIALGIWVLQATGSASAMAVIMSTRVVVSILLGAIGGTVVDRTDRRRLMIAMDLVRFATLGGIALLVRSGNTSLLPIIALTALTAAASTFFGPAFQASMVHIVGKEELPRASSLLQISNTICQIVGPFLGGTVVALYGGWTALSLDALSFLVAALAVVIAGSFPSPRQESAQRSSFWGDMVEGVRYIGRNPLAKAVVMSAPLINFFGNAIGVLLPVIAIKIWLASPTQFGALEALFPAGFAIGAAMVMVTVKKMRRRGAWMMGGVAIAGALISLQVLMPTVTAAMPITLLSGLALAFTNVLLQLTLQTEVAPEMQGRVFGTLNSLVNVASPLALLSAGLLGDLVGPVLVAAISGVLLMVAAAASYLFSPGLRNFD